MTQAVYSREDQVLRHRRAGNITVPDAGTTSNAYISDFSGNIGILLPAGVDASTAMTFLVSTHPEGDYQPLYADTGSLISINVATGARAINIRDLAGWYAFKVVLASQVGDVIIEVIAWDN